MLIFSVFQGVLLQPQTTAVAADSDQVKVKGGLSEEEEKRRETATALQNKAQNIQFTIIITVY